MLGASTPVAIEAMGALSIHPMIELVAVADDLLAGQRVTDVYPGMAVNLRLSIIEASALKDQSFDLVIAALPLAESIELLPKLLKDQPELRLADTSPLFRPAEKEMFHRLYNVRHPAPELLPTFTYGWTQGRAGELVNAQRAALPGAFASAVVAALEPLARGQLLHGKVQVSTTVASSEYPGEGEGSMRARAVLDEPQVMESTLWLGGEDAPFELLPAVTCAGFERGMYATVFVPMGDKLALGSLNALYRERYDNALFVRLLERPPELKDVLGSNRIHLYLRVAGDTLCAVVALDNVSRRAMSAIACANLMLGLPEEAGLMFPGRSW